jgi:tripeptidyl-peptidase-1
MQGNLVLIRFMLIRLLLLATLATLAAPVRPNGRSLHERHTGPPPSWRPHMSRVDPNTKISVTVAVQYKPTSIHRLRSQLDKRSDPTNILFYGKWLSLAEVDALVAPDPADVQIVKDWLNTTHIRATSNGAFLTTELTLKEYEHRVGQPLMRYTHDTTGTTTFRLGQDCYLPSRLPIDVLSPSVGRFPQFATALPTLPKAPEEGSTPNPIPTPPVKITPDVLRTLYRLGDQYGNGNHSNNTQATTNFLGQYVEPSDLSKFFHLFAPNATTTTPSRIVGSENQHDPGVEAMLDAEYIMAVGQNINTDFYFTSGGQPGNPTDEPWLAWLTNLANATQVKLFCPQWLLFLVSLPVVPNYWQKYGLFLGIVLVPASGVFVVFVC